MGDRELKYKISFKADLTGANRTASTLRSLKSETESVMDSMATRAGAAQAGFQGIERAARGDTGAIFGLARAIKALWDVIANGSPMLRIITMLSMGIALIGSAYKKVKASQDETTASTKECTEAMDRFQAALKAVNAARGALSMDKEIQSLDQLAKSYDRAKKAAEDMNEAEGKLRGERHKVELVAIDEREARAQVAAGGDRGELDRIRFNSERERAAVKYSHGFEDMEAQKRQIADRIKLIREERNALSGQAPDQFWGKGAEAAPIYKSEKRVERIREELRALGVGRGGADMPAEQRRDKYTAKRQELEAALKENESLRKVDDKRREQIKERLAATAQELTMLEQQQAVLEGQKKAMDAELDASNAKLAAEESAIENARNAEAAQKRLVELKRTEKELQDAILRSSKETADIAEAESGESIAGLQDDAEYLKRKYQHQYKMVNDPAYRAGHVGMEDETTKAEAQEQKQWEKKVARAYSQQARGARGKGITDIITANETGRAAGAARRELDNAQREQAMNIKKSTEYLSKIKADLEENLQFSG